MLVTGIVLIYYLNSSLTSTNKMRFIQIVMINVFAKIVGCLTILIIYQKTIGNISKLAVLVFLGIYFLYSIYETVYIYRMSKTNV